MTAWELTVEVEDAAFFEWLFEARSKLSLSDVSGNVVDEYIHVRDVDESRKTWYGIATIEKSR